MLIAGVPDRIDVFARGKDDSLWTIARNGEVWGGWVNLGGKLTSAPAGRAIFPAFMSMSAEATAQSHRARLSAGDLDGLGQSRRRHRRDPRPAQGGDLPDIRRRHRVPRLRLPCPDRPGPAGLKDEAGCEDCRQHRQGPPHPAALRQRIQEAKVVATTPVPAIPGEIEDHLFVDFTPAPTVPLRNVTLLGNVAAASHGETQPLEALGHGDGAKAFQTFKLSRPNLTYLQSATSLEGTAALEIRVNGELLKEAPSFFGRRATDRVYTARRNDNAETYIAFGDGTTGARLPSGAMNVTATYRTGLGIQGLMKAGQLSIPLERPAGLRSVVNPLPADGAADPETRDRAREAAPNTVKTFGRAVSLADFEAIATASGLAARASVTWVWSEFERAVHVTVAGPEGNKLSAASLALLHGALDTARDPNRSLILANFVRVPIVISARLLRDPAFEADAMLEDARSKLLARFAFDAMPLGAAVFASEIYAKLQSATGVLAVDIDVFHLKHYQDLTATERAVRAVDTGSLQPHIRIFPARPTPPLALIDRFARAGFEGPPPPVLAAEQAFIEDPAADLVLTAVEAL